MNFTRGFPNWATSVGVKSLVTGEWLAGAVVAPAMGLSYFAKRGGGAWVIRGENKTQLHGPDANRF